MDSTKLKTFLTVAKEKSFTKTADVLYITPTAVKKQIDSLEDEVGVQLLRRHSAGCSLTPAGEVFRAHASSIIKRMEKAVTDAKAAAETSSRELSIGYSIHLDHSFLSEIGSRFSESYPGYTVNFLRLKKSQLPVGLQNEDIDAFIYMDPSKNDFRGYQRKVIGNTRIHVIMRKKHPLADAEKVTLGDLVPYPVYIETGIDTIPFEQYENDAGEPITIRSSKSRDTILPDMRRGAVVIYPCAVDHDISVPFDHEPLDLVMVYPSLTDAIEKLMHITEEVLQDTDLHIMR